MDIGISFGDSEFRASDFGMISSMRTAALFIGCALAASLIGCAESSAPTTQPVSAYERSENAIKDPFSYSPDVGKPEDITNGSIKKDADDVLNP